MNAYFRPISAAEKWWEICEIALKMHELEY